MEKRRTDPERIIDGQSSFINPPPVSITISCPEIGTISWPKTFKDSLIPMNCVSHLNP